jgi:hypothetical protein
LVPVALGQA